MLRKKKKKIHSVFQIKNKTDKKKKSMREKLYVFPLVNILNMVWKLITGGKKTHTQKNIEFVGGVLRAMRGGEI